MGVTEQLTQHTVFASARTLRQSTVFVMQNAEQLPSRLHLQATVPLKFTTQSQTKPLLHRKYQPFQTSIPQSSCLLQF